MKGYSNSLNKKMSPTLTLRSETETYNIVLLPQ